AYITVGPDGALWFTNAGFSGKKIGRITTAGTVTTFTAPVSNGQGITTGADGALWFADGSGHAIDRMTTAGVVTTYLLSQFGPLSGTPVGISPGPDGTLVFSIRRKDQIGRITTAGVLTKYGAAPAEVPDISVPLFIAEGADGAMWFTNGISIG